MDLGDDAIAEQLSTGARLSGVEARLSGLEKQLKEIMDILSKGTTLQVAQIPEPVAAATKIDVAAFTAACCNL